MRYRSICVVPVILGLVAVSFAARIPSQSSLLPMRSTRRSFWPDPPTIGSEENQAEIETLLRLQKSRGDADNARILAEDDLTVFAFSDVLGPWFPRRTAADGGVV